MTRRVELSVVFGTPRGSPIFYLILLILLSYIFIASHLYQSDYIQNEENDELLHVKIPYENSTQNTSKTKTHGHRYVYNSEHVCDVPGQNLIIVFIHSAVGHFEQRQLIRSTWGLSEYCDIYTVRHVFILAMPDTVDMKVSHKVSSLNMKWDGGGGVID